MSDLSSLTAVILCGGAGTRLWPLSRQMFPKQFLPLLKENSESGPETLFGHTMRRVEKLGIKKVIIVCYAPHRFFVSNCLPDNDDIEYTVITEPIQKNTAPATTIAALAAIEKYGDPLLLVMPADHLIARPEAFQEAIDKASAVAEAGFIVSFGVAPTREETGFGYITVEETGDGGNDGPLKVVSFKEKPDKRTARQLMSGGKCYWNSGIFLFKAKPYLDVIGETCREIREVCARAYRERSKDFNFVKINSSEFEKCPEISIDYAVMEHARNLMLVPTDMQWRDLGSWDALAGIFRKDKDGNRVTGNPALISSKGNIVFSDNKLVSLMGIDDCIVINSEDAILVAKQNCAGSLKSLVNTLKGQKRTEVEEHRKVYRPWGSYETILESANFKIKLLIINPGQSLSLQSHQHRSEHWVVVKGEAVISCDDATLTLGVNQSTYIPALSKHRIENQSDGVVNIVEVQCGDYLGEDDIVRYEDHYGRHRD